MTDRLIVGPYHTIEIDNGVQAPFYIIPFDEQGRCQAPLTRDQLLTTLLDGTYTDAFLFSHGWNADWNVASSTYNTFLQGYMQMRSKYGLSYAHPFRPILVGIFWPSVALVMPWESAPAFAGLAENDPKIMDMQVAQERQDVESIAAALAGDDIEQFYALAQKAQGLSRDEALELAKILAPFYRSSSDELPSAGAAPSFEEIVQLWQDAARMRTSTHTSGRFGFADEPAGEPGVAGGIGSVLDPRLIIRLCTVLQMKDRAGTVGAHGVGTLLQNILASNGSVRLHLIGHSYGCRVVLSALCYPQLPRPIHSLLLLQPAISYLCFAKDATGTGQPGGYRGAFQRVELPIMTTFSSHDLPLHNFFHLAVRRPSDIGEMQIAGAPPSRYAALGGYGPGGCDEDCQVVPLKNLGDPYNLRPGVPKIYALNGEQIIHDHGDFDNDPVWWALFEQVTN